MTASKHYCKVHHEYLMTATKISKKVIQKLIAQTISVTSTTKFRYNDVSSVPLAYCKRNHILEYMKVITN